MHTAAKTGQSEIFETIIREEEVKNPRNSIGQTLFHIICERGHTRQRILEPGIKSSNQKLKRWQKNGAKSFKDIQKINFFFCA